MTEASSDNVVPDTVTAAHEGFGAVLKREREAQGISLGDMATLSRLSVDQIRALESEDVEKLPLPVYTRAFIRDVAKQLEIDCRPLVADYVARFGEADEGQIPSDDPSTEVVIGRRHENRGLKISSFALLAAVLAVGGWGLYSEFVASDDAEALPPVSVFATPEAPSDKVLVTPVEPALKAPVDTKAEEPAGKEKAELTDDAKLAAQAKAEEKPQAEEAKPADDEPEEPSAALTADQHLVIKVNRDVWIHVRSIRGQNLVARTVKAGATIDMMIPRGSHFTIGNTAAVDMTVDGEPYSFETKTNRGIAKFILK